MRINHRNDSPNMIINYIHVFISSLAKTKRISHRHVTWDSSTQSLLLKNYSRVRLLVASSMIILGQSLKNHIRKESFSHLTNCRKLCTACTTTIFYCKNLCFESKNLDINGKI